MARFILIDNYSGVIFGDSANFNGRVFEGSALEFIRALDANIGQHGCEYVERFGKQPANLSGYHVFRADCNGSEAVPVVTDGQDQEMIAAVNRDCRYIGFFETIGPED